MANPGTDRKATQTAIALLVSLVPAVNLEAVVSFAGAHGQLGWRRRAFAWLYVQLASKLLGLSESPRPYDVKKVSDSQYRRAASRISRSMAPKGD